MLGRFMKKEQRQDRKEGQVKRPKVKNRSVRPKGFLARKFGVLTFWALFGFMLLVVLVNVLRPSEEANAGEEAGIHPNKAVSQEAVQFATDFAQTYFTWVDTPEGKEQRQEAMSAFLGSGLSESAGLELDGLGWNARFVSAEVKDTEEKGENIAQLTLKVTFKLYQTKGEEKESIKYFVVPVAYDGHSFGVYELPKFTFVSEGTTLDKVTYPKLKRADTQTADEVKHFLNTFFRSFAEDPQDQLNYILAKDGGIQGLHQSMAFEKVKSTEVFQDNREGEDRYVVYAEVTLTDPETGILFDTHYQLTVLKRNGKFVAVGMDDLHGQAVEAKSPLAVDETSESKKEAQEEPKPKEKTEEEESPEPEKKEKEQKKDEQKPKSEKEEKE